MNRLALFLMIFTLLGCSQNAQDTSGLQQRLVEIEAANQKLQVENQALEQQVNQATKDIAQLEKQASTMVFKVVAKEPSPGEAKPEPTTQIGRVVQETLNTYSTWSSGLTNIQFQFGNKDCQQNTALSTYFKFVAFSWAHDGLLSGLTDPALYKSVDLGDLKAVFGDQFRPMADAMAESYKQVVATANWQEKFDTLKAEIAKSDYHNWSGETFHALGFSKFKNACYSEVPEFSYGEGGEYYGSISFERWLYSFWLRRHVDGTLAMTVKALEYYLGAPLTPIAGQE